MAYTERLALVISTGVKQNGSDVFSILDPDSGGAATFAVPLVPIGSPAGTTPTYWGASSQLTTETYNALTNMTTTQFKAYVDQVAASYTPPRTPPGNMTAFKNNIQISTMGFWAFVSSLGLERAR